MKTNSKIKQLIEDCTETTEIVNPETGISHYMEFFDKEKFAELIVRECIEQVKPTSHHEAFAQCYLGGVDGLELLERKVAQIKKHFGIEK